MTASEPQHGRSLDPEDVEAIAHRVADLVASRTGTIRYLDTAEVAEALSASEDWVRAHAGELGAIRLGSGPKGPLRFDETKVREALERRRVPEPPKSRRSRRARRVRSADGVDLLPLPPRTSS